MTLCTEDPVWNVFPVCPVDASVIYIYRLPGKYSQATLPNRPRPVDGLCVAFYDQSHRFLEKKGQEVFLCHWGQFSYFCLNWFKTNCLADFTLISKSGRKKWRNVFSYIFILYRIFQSTLLLCLAYTWFSSRHSEIYVTPKVEDRVEHMFFSSSLLWPKFSVF